MNDGTWWLVQGWVASEPVMFLLPLASEADLIHFTRVALPQGFYTSITYEKLEGVEHVGPALYLVSLPDFKSRMDAGTSPSLPWRSPHTTTNRHGGGDPARKPEEQEVSLTEAERDFLKWMIVLFGCMPILSKRALLRQLTRIFGNSSSNNSMG